MHLSAGFIFHCTICWTTEILKCCRHTRFKKKKKNLLTVVWDSSTCNIFAKVKVVNEELFRANSLTTNYKKQTFYFSGLWQVWLMSFRCKFYSHRPQYMYSKRLNSCIWKAMGRWRSSLRCIRTCLVSSPSVFLLVTYNGCNFFTKRNIRIDTSRSTLQPLILLNSCIVDLIHY